MSETTVKKQNRLQAWMSSFKAMSAADKRRTVNSLLVNNAMYIIIALVVIFIAIRVPAYRSVNSIVNIVNLTAAKLPIALGIAGCIVLTGTDISAGRMVGLAAVIVASMSITANKIFPGLEPLPIIIPLLAAIAARAMIGFINGFSVAKFDLHPFIMTLATQLITYGIILIYLKMGTNNGQTLSGFDPQYRDLVTGTLFTIAGVRVPMYVLYSLILVGLMWVVWNKTTFGKNMFAVGSNKEAAEVSGVNVHRTIILVFVLAAVMYALTGFIDGARVASVNANTGLNYECDAIAACVIGGVSFVGGTGRISGIVIGVLLLQIIFTGLNFLSVDQNLLYIIKGLIILVACAIDMRKYLAKK
ncbi:galactose/methyl galactoside ABC transporter permease MglC [Faecalibaculum rodentium]|uniref:galactose/methyl galactoside ABC transporter permease MglC n=1 Tax=Faecalibaculum rodentium TaxID=1702221 RepID=UPI00261013B8|nr:beta-methylgalactoside transporter [Faecalibaculum rodentium]